VLHRLGLKSFIEPEIPACVSTRVCWEEFTKDTGAVKLHAVLADVILMLRNE
jgi:hypothetical protein